MLVVYNLEYALRRNAVHPLGAWLEELNKRILQYVGRDARNLQVGHAYLLENGKPITDFARFARVIREDIILC